MYRLGGEARYFVWIFVTMFSCSAFISRSTLAVALFAAPACALACSCSDMRNSVLFARAQHVFLARLGPVQDMPVPHAPASTASFEVLETVKGHPERLPLLWADAMDSRSSCATRLVAGETYIVLVKDDGELHRCTGSKIYRAERHAAILALMREMARGRGPSLEEDEASLIAR